MVLIYRRVSRVRMEENDIADFIGKRVFRYVIGKEAAELYIFWCEFEDRDGSKHRANLGARIGRNHRFGVHVETASYESTCRSLGNRIETEVRFHNPIYLLDIQRVTMPHEDRHVLVHMGPKPPPS